MKDLNIKIEFFSPWHCGSGLSAGADTDSLVIKDTNGKRPKMSQRPYLRAFCKVRKSHF